MFPGGRLVAVQKAISGAGFERRLRPTRSGEPGTVLGFLPLLFQDFKDRFHLIPFLSGLHREDNLKPAYSQDILNKINGEIILKMAGSPF